MGFDIMKTLIKVGKQIVYVLIAGVFVLYTDQVALLGLAPLLTGLENYLRHMND